jgi:hypothetical protein
MKKILTYLILAISILTLTACGGTAAASVGVDSAEIVAINPEAESDASGSEVVAASEVVAIPEVD